MGWLRKFVRLILPRRVRDAVWGLRRRALQSNAVGVLRRWRSRWRDRPAGGSWEREIARLERRLPSNPAVLPRLARARIRLGLELLETDRFGEAREIRDRVPSDALRTPHGLRLTGELAVRQGDWDVAEDAWRTLAEHRPREGNRGLIGTHVEHAKALRHRGEYEAARGQAERALALDPTSPRTHRELAKVAGATGQWELAEMYWAKVPHQTDGDREHQWSSRLRHARHQRKHGHIRTAIDELETLRGQRPSDQQVLAELDKCFTAVEDWSSASHVRREIARLQPSVKADRNVAAASLEVSRRHRLTGDLESATQTLDEITPGDNGWVRAVLARESAAIASADPAVDREEAIKSWEHALEIHRLIEWRTDTFDGEALALAGFEPSSLSPELALTIARTLTRTRAFYEAVPYLTHAWSDRRARPVAVRTFVELNHRLSRHLLTDMMLRVYRTRFTVDEWSEPWFVHTALRADEIEEADRRLVDARSLLPDRSVRCEQTFKALELEVALRGGDTGRFIGLLESIARSGRRLSGPTNWMLDIDTSFVEHELDACLRRAGNIEGAFGLSMRLRLLAVAGRATEAVGLALDHYETTGAPAAATFALEELNADGEVDGALQLARRLMERDDLIGHQELMPVFTAAILAGHRSEAEEALRERVDRLVSDGRFLDLHAEYLQPQSSSIYAQDAKARATFFTVSSLLRAGIAIGSLGDGGEAAPELTVPKITGRDRADTREEQAPRFSLRPLRGAFLGQRCFLVANGPSIKHMDLSPLTNEHVFLMNRGYLHPDLDARPFTFHITSDVAVYRDYWQEMLDLPARYQLLPRRVCDYDLRRRGGQPCTGPEVIAICELPAKFANLTDDQAIDFVSRWNHDAGEPLLLPSRSVATKAAQVALYLGFSEVYVLGVDLDYSGPSTHFYGTLAKEASRLARFRTGGIGPESVNQSFATLDAVYRSRGTRLRNAGRGGKLDSLDRVRFENLF